MSGKIRIIGGRCRGKQIGVIDQETLRPTPNRVRETLFNWLMHDITNANCLDAFAGSGALGLEAFSRGAAQVCFLEKDKRVFQQLKKNIQLIQRPECAPTSLTSQNVSFFDFAKHTQQTFDLIFLDPPFQAKLLPECLALIHGKNLLKSSGLVYLESDNALPLSDPHWVIVKSGKASDIFFGLFSLKPR